MLSIFNILQVIDLGKIIMMINTIKTIILIITTIIIKIAINYKKKRIIFVIKKVVISISIKNMNNRQ